jgi:hypothetical protein
MLSPQTFVGMAGGKQLKEQSVQRTHKLKYYLWWRKKIPVKTNRKRIFDFRFFFPETISSTFAAVTRPPTLGVSHRSSML